MDCTLAIPDLSHYARRDLDKQVQDGVSVSNDGGYRNRERLKKVIVKLSGAILLCAGLVFERDLGPNSRSLEFKPHYEVVLKHPQYAKVTKGQVSHFGHFDHFYQFVCLYLYLYFAKSFCSNTMHLAGSVASIFICLLR